SKSEAAQTLYGSAGVVTFFTLVSRVLGMVRDLVIAHRFGAGAASDAWVQAFRIPNALRRLTAEGSMTIAFVPTYVEERTREGQEAATRFARQTLGLVLFATLLLTGLGMVFSEALTLMFSPGFQSDPEKFDLTATLLRWSFPYLVLVSLVAWAMGVLNAEKRFAAPAAAPVFLNLGIIVFVIWLAWAFTPPILAVCAGVLAGGVAQVALQLPSLVAVGVPIVPLGDWRSPAMRRLFTLMLPSLFGVGVYQINLILLGIIASYLPTGQIFHYNNATRLTELVMGLFTFAFATAGLPTLSEHRSREDWGKMRDTLSLTLSATLFTVFPALAGLVAGAHGIVAMLYLHGAFNPADVLSTAAALQAMALGMPAVALVRVMVPVFYAFGDARAPVGVSALTVVVTAVLGWVLSARYEVVGLSLGLSLGAWFQCGLLALSLRGRGQLSGGWFPWRAVRLQGAMALGMGLLVFWIQGYGDWAQGSFSLHNWGVFLIFILGGAGGYLAGTLALGEGEARNWLNLFQRLAARLTRRWPRNRESE
ncbi:MAG: murein biosynthesis integral membrane protein MurJ, partial [Deltaproteobacteria bacterium]|nr:murein biosynthesis integral membrane protein MurJ [Deltaproteobacteria bacterium]